MVKIFTFAMPVSQVSCYLWLSLVHCKCIARIFVCFDKENIHPFQKQIIPTSFQRNPLSGKSWYGRTNTEEIMHAWSKAVEPTDPICVAIFYERHVIWKTKDSSSMRRYYQTAGKATVIIIIPILPTFHYKLQANSIIDRIQHLKLFVRKNQ